MEYNRGLINGLVIMFVLIGALFAVANGCQPDLNHESGECYRC